MRCFICDRDLKDPKIDPRDGKIKYCTICEEIIDECVADMRNPDEDVLLYIDNQDESLELKSVL